jgi:hypothetical protein
MSLSLNAHRQQRRPHTLDAVDFVYELPLGKDGSRGVMDASDFVEISALFSTPSTNALTEVEKGKYECDICSELAASELGY